MELATWILVIILSVTLLIFLVLGIIFFIKMIKIANEMQSLIDKGHDIAEKADVIAGHVKNMASVGVVGSVAGLVKNIANRYNNGKANTNKQSEKGE